MKSALTLLLLPVLVFAHFEGDVVGTRIFHYNGVEKDEVVVDLTGISGPDEAQKRLNAALDTFLDGLMWMWEETFVINMWSGSVRIFGSSVENVEAVRVRIEEILDNFFGRSFGGMTFQLYEGAIVIDLTP